MQLIKTKTGYLYISQLPSLEELYDLNKIDIIWNLAEEFASFSKQESLFAHQVLLANIKDFSIPTDISAFKYQLSLVVKCLKDNGKVLVHCAAGHGRTGMALACILNKLNGTPIKKCLDFTQKTCGGPETKLQIDFVESL